MTKKLAMLLLMMTLTTSVFAFGGFAGGKCGSKINMLAFQFCANQKELQTTKTFPDGSSYKSADVSSQAFKECEAKAIIVEKAKNGCK